MTISGILGATGSDKPGDVFEQLILQLNEQSDNILENENELVKLNKLKITSYFINYSKLIMESLGIEPAKKM